METVIGVALRVLVMYAYAVALTRLSGKRELGQLSPVDFVVVLIIGDMFDDVFFLEIPVVKGLIGFTSIVVIHQLLSFATSRSKALDIVLGSGPVLLVREGLIQAKGLRKERLREEDLWSFLRMQDIESLEEIKEARLEPTGHLSVLKRPFSKSAQKSDRPLLRAAR